MSKINKKPNWITGETLIDTTNHHKEEIWIEEHENPKTEEKVWLVIDTSGSDYGYGVFGLIGVYDNYAEANNRIGEEYGFDEFWEQE